MPTWDKILHDIENVNPSTTLKKYIEKLHDVTGNSVICYISAFTLPRKPEAGRHHPIIDQDMQGFMTCSHEVGKKSLDLILHTPGGDYEATKRIINYLHETYSYIRVFIPHLAMSSIEKLIVNHAHRGKIISS